MDDIWLGGMGTVGNFGLNDTPLQRTHGDIARANQTTLEHRTAIQDLSHHIERLSLLNQALWELLREHLNLTDADLQAKALEVDLRDGVQDDKMTTRAVACPTCNRVSSSRHFKCLYCGQLFERPLFG